MRLHRLKVTNFAGIGEADIAFGPGLNVLFGPNDLGKSSLADAIRLALLLPFGSTDSDPYIPWAGGGDPVVHLTFATDEQRYWRVRKQFGKGGSAFLDESRNGREFDEVERSRKVDGKLREILSWGLAEPGGGGGAKGLPESFLATVLLSTQSDVTAVLGASLQDDRAGSGNDRIAAALQAVAQDTLFLALLRETQARLDEAFTEKGAKSKAKGSVFKAAADRLNETRVEKEGFQKLVDESEGVEQQLRALVVQRATHEGSHARAAERVAEVQMLAQQTAEHTAAVENVRTATDIVRRVKKLGDDVLASERLLEQLVGKQQAAERLRDETRVGTERAADALRKATDEARSAEADADTTETLARQQLELRRNTAERAATEAQRVIEAAAEAQRLVGIVSELEHDLTQQTEDATRAREQATKLAETLTRAKDGLARYDILERGLAVRTADAQVAGREAEVKRKSALQELLTRTTAERDAVVVRRKALDVPDAGRLAPMRKLANELLTARGALDVGLMVTVVPVHPPLSLRLARDGAPVAQEAISRPLDIEANAELDLTIGDVASVTVRGGRRDARGRVRALEDRWVREVAPILAAAHADDLEALEAKVGDARELDARMTAVAREAAALQEQLDALSGAEVALRDASQTAVNARAALEGVAPANLAADLDALGADPSAGLRARRQQVSGAVARAASEAAEASTAVVLAEERTTSLTARHNAAVAARDAALVAFPSGPVIAGENAQAAQRATWTELQAIAKDLTSLRGEREARARRLEQAVSGAREVASKAREAGVAAEAEHTKALTATAEEKGRLEGLRKQLAAEDLVAAERAALVASDALSGIPVPARMLAPDELGAVRMTLARAKRELDDIDREIQRTQGALEQVGGAVAREHLQDAVEAFELAARHERELEADYDAWKLLLEQMKEADAAQASNLGQVLAPAITRQFQALTAQRYQGIQLTAQLGTDGVVVGGNVRPHDRISVGTREQLSTLYRLCLGEYLKTTIVLDDQLVQSDGARMDWFRALLAVKARSFQIVVFTCRPADYLGASAMPNGEATHADTEDGFLRALDLGRAVRRR